MKDIIVGIVAILVGALFCFRGWLAMRVVIPIWGAFGGFVFAAMLRTRPPKEERQAPKPQA